jgi:hypothetical protein
MTSPARIAVVLAVCTIAGAGCSHPASLRSTETMKGSAMNEPLRALDQHPAAVVSVTYGTEYFGDGQFTVTVEGNGRVAVEQRSAGARSDWEVRVAPARIAEIGRLLADHRLTAARTTHLPRSPGDTPLLLRFTCPDTPPFQVELWHADRYDDPDLDAIVALFEELAREATRRP